MGHWSVELEEGTPAEIAACIQATVTGEDRKQWQQRAVADCALESLAVVRWQVHQLPASGEINASYSVAARAVIRTRLAQASARRLAAELNLPAVKTIRQALVNSSKKAGMSKCVICVLLLLSLVGIQLAEAQQPVKVPHIDYVSGTGDASNPGPYVEALRQGLRELGHIDGKNIVIEFRGLSIARSWSIGVSLQDGAVSYEFLLNLKLFNNELMFVVEPRSGSPHPTQSMHAEQQLLRLKRLSYLRTTRAH